MPDWVKVNNGKHLSVGDLARASEELIQAGRDFSIWLLVGDMGAGKTTLIQSICKAMGVENIVTSPTFSIVNEYLKPDGTPVYHFDFYRIKNEMEAYDLGAHEYLDSGFFCFVEWPDKIKSLLPSRYFEVRLESIDPSHRIIYYNRHD